MKKLITLVFVVVVSALNAQSWCPTGAEWYYSRLTMSGPAYTKVTYAGPAVVNSVQCQQLNYYSETFDMNTGNVGSSTLTPYYTRTLNNVIFLLNKQSNNFDTLYNYNAIPGSEWLLPASYTYTFLNTCNKTKVTVTDTGHKLIQSVNLKWFKVTLDNINSQTDTIYERIGFLKYYFLQYDGCSSHQDYMEGGSLRCYSDNQVSNYKKTNTACNFLDNSVSVKENSLLYDMRIYPNPANTFLTIQLSGSGLAHEKLNFELTDIAGRKQKMGEVHSTKDHIQIDLSNLDKGIYFLQLYNGNDLVGIKKLVKE